MNEKMVILKINIFFLFFNLLLSIVYSYPNYESCKDKYRKEKNIDVTLLRTQYGLIEGNCFNVLVNDPDDEDRNLDVLSWLNVPYAQPPINEDRFKAAKAPLPWTGTRDGTKFGNKCQQFGFLPGDLFGVDDTLKINISEDCLYLNVFSPALNYVKTMLNGNRRGNLLPILVYIHGGGFSTGSAVDDLFDPSTLIAVSNVIVVTLNYRLGALGFLHLEDTEAVGNQGFIDQNMALKWIYENARSFGGDPNKITISGESAGAFSVGYHLISAKSWPYFGSAILQSGSTMARANSFLKSEDITNRTKGILQMAGCDVSLPNDKILQCAQQLPIQQLKQVWQDYLDQVVCDSKNVACLTVTQPYLFTLDGDWFKYDPFTSLSKGHYKKANILLGYNKNEGGFFLSISRMFGFTNEEVTQNAYIDEPFFRKFITDYFVYYPYYPNKPSDSFFPDLYKTYLGESFTQPNNNTSASPSLKYFNALIDIIGEALFICPMIDLANFYSKSAQNVYLYSYEYRIPASLNAEIFGAVHSDELPMVFGEPLSRKQLPLISFNPLSSTKVNYSDSERRLSKQMIGYWTNFVKYQNPNGPFHDRRHSRQTKWPEYEQKSSPNSWWYYLFHMYQSRYMILNLETRIGDDLSNRKCDFWRNN